MPPDERVKVGVAAIVEQPELFKLLMIRRGGTGPFASDGSGTWSVPGGWLDYGETPMEAAARETKEESGVIVQPVEELGFVCCLHASLPLQIVTLFVWCEWMHGDPHVTEPQKCPEVGWRDLEDLDTLPLFKPLDEWHKRGRV